MKNKLKTFHIISFFITAILGTLLHFAFKLSSNNQFVGAFSAVNESTWEHLKLLFFPMLLTSIVGFFFLKENTNNFWCSRTIGIFCSLIFIIVFFYTYTGIIGRNFAFIDISSFFIAALLGELISFKVMQSNFSCTNFFPIIILILTASCFVLFTFFPPKIGLFKDPITSTYGKISFI